MHSKFAGLKNNREMRGGQKEGVLEGLSFDRSIETLLKICNIYVIAIIDSVEEEEELLLASWRKDRCAI